MRNTGMTNDLMERASAMALDLRTNRVDPNEAQKALAYLRTHSTVASLSARTRRLSTTATC